MEEKTVKRRSSLFDVNAKKKIGREFPEEDNNLVYPLDYIEKLNDEYYQWKNHVAETCTQREDYIKKIRTLKTEVFDVFDVLSQEQKNLLVSINDCFQQYLTKAELTFKTLPISANKLHHHNDGWETLTKSLDMERKMKLQIREKLLK